MCIRDRPKDRRIYTAFTGILAEQRPHRETAGYHRAQAGGGRQTEGRAEAGPIFFICTLYTKLTNS